MDYRPLKTNRKTEIVTCGRCEGLGNYIVHGHYGSSNLGMCFACRGAGNVEIYTADEMEDLERLRIKRHKLEDEKADTEDYYDSLEATDDDAPDGFEDMDIDPASFAKPHDCSKHHVQDRDFGKIICNICAKEIY